MTIGRRCNEALVVVRDEVRITRVEETEVAASDAFVATDDLLATDAVFVAAAVVRGAVFAATGRRTTRFFFFVELLFAAGVGLLVGVDVSPNRNTPESMSAVTEAKKQRIVS